MIVLSNCAKLRYLDVKHNAIGDNGYRLIAECNKMPQLADLKIYACNVGSQEAKNALRRGRAMQALRMIS